MTEQTLTLGARILANQEYAKNHPLDAARKRAIREGKEAQFSIVESFHNRFKEHVIQSVDNCEYPAPLCLTKQEERALEIRGSVGNSGEVSKSSVAFPVWQALVAWAEDQDLHLTWMQRYDGGGQDSWWTLQATPRHL